MFDLTVVIPTYNRKARLSIVLDAFQNQTVSDFSVFISDNASNYEVETVLEGRPKSFCERVHIHHNPSNIASNGNIANLFLHAPGKWIWFMGDDDLPKADAVEQVLKDIRGATSDVGMMQYTLYKIPETLINEGQRYHKVENLKQFSDFYEKLDPKGKRHVGIEGDLIFLSNKVYNMEKIKPYIGWAFIYSYMQIPQLMPALNMLDQQCGSMLFVNQRIVDYCPPDGDHWNIEKTVRGMSAFWDIPFNVSRQEKIRLCRAVVFGCHYVLGSYYENGKPGKEYLKDIYQRIYQKISTPKEKLKFHVALMASTNNGIFRFVLKLKKIKRVLRERKKG